MIVGYLPYTGDNVRSADFCSLKIMSDRRLSPMAAPLLTAGEAPGLTPARCTRWTRRMARRSCLRLPPHRLLVQIYFGRPLLNQNWTVCTSPDGIQQMQLREVRRVRRVPCVYRNPRPCLLRLRQGRASMCCISRCTKRTPRTRMQYQRLAVEGFGMCDRGMQTRNLIKAQCFHH